MTAGFGCPECKHVLPPGYNVVTVTGAIWCPYCERDKLGSDLAADRAELSHMRGRVTWNHAAQVELDALRRVESAARALVTELVDAVEALHDPVILSQCDWLNELLDRGRQALDAATAARSEPDAAGLYHDRIHAEGPGRAARSVKVGAASAARGEETSGYDPDRQSASAPSGSAGDDAVVYPTPARAPERPALTQPAATLSDTARWAEGLRAERTGKSKPAAESGAKLAAEPARSRLPTVTIPWELAAKLKLFTQLKDAGYEVAEAETPAPTSQAEAGGELGRLFHGCPVFLCAKTGNPYGTDTTAVGDECDCVPCRQCRYVSAAEARAEKLQAAAIQLWSGLSHAQTTLDLARFQRDTFMAGQKYFSGKLKQAEQERDAAVSKADALEITLEGMRGELAEKAATIVQLQLMLTEHRPGER